MRFTSAIIAVVAATGAVAQIPPALQNFIGQLSPSCQSTVLRLAVTSDLSQCLRVPQIVPIVTSAISASNTSSLIPYVDQLLQIGCGQSGCSNTTLTGAYTDVVSGCSTDLAKYDISNATVRTVFRQYPLAREVVCLGTSQPIVSNLTGSTSNTTTNTTTGNATYCPTSLLTGIENRIGQNLSVGFLSGVINSYMNGSFNASRYTSVIRPTDVCNDCIFAATEVIGVAYPAVANVTLRQLGIIRNGTATSASNTTITGNTTIPAALNATCVAQNLTWSPYGILPSTISLGAVNSTFGFNLTTGNGTRSAPAQTTPIKRNVVDIKARWFGEYL